VRPAKVHVRAVVSQQPEDIGVVVQRRHRHRRYAVRVDVVHDGVGRAREQPHSVCPREAATMSGVLLSLKGWKATPLRLRGVPPAGSNLLTAAASPATHAANSAPAGMFFGMILRLDSRDCNILVGRRRRAGGSETRVRGLGWDSFRTRLAIVAIKSHRIHRKGRKSNQPSWCAF
jgi:hypothetical protein